MTVMWLRLRRPCGVMQHRATFCSQLRLRLWCYCDLTAMWLQPEICTFIFLRRFTRLQPITMQESVWASSTSCGVIVYCYHVFLLINKGNLLFAVILLFNYVDFIRYGTWITYEIDVRKQKYLSFSLRIDPLRFQAGCHKRRLNLAYIFVFIFFWSVNARCYCVRFSFFSIPSQEIGSGKRLQNDLFCVEWDVKPQLSVQRSSYTMATN